MSSILVESLVTELANPNDEEADTNSSDEGSAKPETEEVYDQTPELTESLEKPESEAEIESDAESSTSAGLFEDDSSLQEETPETSFTSEKRAEKRPHSQEDIESSKRTKLDSADSDATEADVKKRQVYVGDSSLSTGDFTKSASDVTSETNNTFDDSLAMEIHQRSKAQEVANADTFDDTLGLDVKTSVEPVVEQESTEVMQTSTTSSIVWYQLIFSEIPELDPFFEKFKMIHYRSG